MLKLKLPTLRCKRCSHRWIPSKTVIRICPHCKSANWQTKRTTRQGLRKKAS